MMWSEEMYKVCPGEGRSMLRKYILHDQLSVKSPALRSVPHMARRPRSIRSGSCPRTVSACAAGRRRSTRTAWHSSRNLRDRTLAVGTRHGDNPTSR